MAETAKALRPSLTVSRSVTTNVLHMSACMDGVVGALILLTVDEYSGSGTADAVDGFRDFLKSRSRPALR